MGGVRDCAVMPDCPNCGRDVQSRMKFCSNCGQDLSVVVPQDQRIPIEDVLGPPPSGAQDGGGHGRHLLRNVVIVVLILLGVLVAIIAKGAGERTSPSTTQDSSSEKDEFSSGKSTAGSEEKSGSEAYVPVTIRVSGQPGTPYSCSYSSFAFEEGKSDPVRYESKDAGVLSTEPVTYTSQAVNSYPWWFDFVAATCNITGGPNATGSLKAEILADGQVKAEEATRPDPPGKKSSESTSIQARWSPRCPKWDVSWDCG